MGFIYRYKDTKDNKYKYIGLVYDDGIWRLHRRIQQHKKDKWYGCGDWEISYLSLPEIQRGDLELYEGHFISLYKTFDFNNKRKTDWGISSLLDGKEFKWECYSKELTDEQRIDYVEVSLRNGKVHIGYPTYVRLCKDGHYRRQYVSNQIDDEIPKVINKKPLRSTLKFLTHFYASDETQAKLILKRLSNDFKKELESIKSERERFIRYVEIDGKLIEEYSKYIEEISNLN